MKAPPCPATTIATENLVTKDAVEYAFSPILVSYNDELTVGTARQIEDHNNTYWCVFPDDRPDGFDPKVCAKK